MEEKSLIFKHYFRYKTVLREMKVTQAFKQMTSNVPVRIKGQ